MPQTFKKRLCKKCNVYIPYNKFINGKKHNLRSRKYCLNCSPFKQHNTKVLSNNEPDKRKIRKYKSDYAYSHRKIIKQKAIEFKGGKCERCGYNKCARALSFHHNDPTQKDFGISGISLSWEKIKIEITKCSLLCMNCH